MVVQTYTKLCLNANQLSKRGKQLLLLSTVFTMLTNVFMPLQISKLTT